MSKTMNINGHEFDVIGEVKSKQLGQGVPLLDIPMMSDEKWHEICLKGHHKQFERAYGRKAVDDEEATEYARERHRIFCKEQGIECNIQW